MESALLVNFAVLKPASKKYGAKGTRKESLVQGGKGAGGRQSILQVPRPVSSRSEFSDQGENRRLTALGGKGTGKGNGAEIRPHLSQATGRVRPHIHSLIL